jgi:hypothetical protein
VNIQEALYAYLAADASLAALVGTRIYPLTLPQKPTYPAICYSKASADVLMAHDGPGDLATDRIQFDCYDDSYGGCQDVYIALREALNGFRGQMSQCWVWGVFFVTSFDSFADVAGVYRIMADFTVEYRAD